MTVSGRSCQRWDSQSPHRHRNDKARKFPDNTVSDAANFCRNPDNGSGPWCYTTDPDQRWEYCEVPPCYGNQAELDIDFWSNV